MLSPDWPVILPLSLQMCSIRLLSIMDAVSLLSDWQHPGVRLKDRACTFCAALQTSLWAGLHTCVRGLHPPALQVNAGGRMQAGLNKAM